MKISKRVREEAALICAAFASTPYAYTNWGAAEVRQTLGHEMNDEADALADDAFWTVARTLDRMPSGSSIDYQLLNWAEADSLIRCGWSPGDEP